MAAANSRQANRSEMSGSSRHSRIDVGTLVLCDFVVTKVSDKKKKNTSHFSKQTLKIRQDGCSKSTKACHHHSSVIWVLVKKNGT